MSRHAVVWIDHHEARVFHVAPESFSETHLHAPHHTLHQKHRDKTHPAEMKHFFEDVVKSLSDAAEILVTGPGSAKLDLVKHVHAHHPGRVDALVGVESADHPTDGQIVAHARKTFEKIDALRGDAG